MSELKATPGPWWVELDKVFAGTPPQYDLIADADPMNYGGVDGKQPMLANANLIAAAPALYAACEKLVELCAENGISTGPHGWVAIGMDALAQARGDLVDPLEQVRS